MSKHGKHTILILRALTAALALLPPQAAFAQASGYVEITEPQSGQVLSGVVDILGTAEASTFTSYDLSFAYAANPTDTWFPIGEIVDKTVSQGHLGSWDTTHITDGDYSLRLRMWLEDGSRRVVIIHGLRVRNTTPVLRPTAAPLLAPGPTTDPAEAAPTSVPASPQPQSPSEASRVVKTFALGGIAMAAGLGVLGLYSYLRPRFRHRRASRRTLKQRRVRKQGRQRSQWS